MAGGGTGGHITPNIAILDLLKSRVKNLDVLYVGSRKGMEATLIPAKGWHYKAISCGKLRRYFSWENFLDTFKTLAGVIQSLGIVLKFTPDVIFCKGGYVSLPMAIAGGLLRKPVIIHESDLDMGLANRIAARFARKICVSFPETVLKWQRDERVIFTGNPVRRELLEGKTEKGYAFCDFKPNKKVLLVMGGSQGAQSINAAIRRNLSDLLGHFQVMHICGKGNVDETSDRQGYVQVEFLGEELKDVYAITDLVISRAGANSLAEIEALHLPAILIPLVMGSRGDQVKNAVSFVKHHPSLLVNDADLDQENFNLADTADSFLKNVKLEETSGARRKGGEKTGQEATERIVEVIEQFTQKHA